MLLPEQFVNCGLAPHLSFALFVVVEGQSQPLDTEERLEGQPRDGEVAVVVPAVGEFEPVARLRREIGSLHLHLPSVLPSVGCAEPLFDGLLHYGHKDGHVI